MWYINSQIGETTQTMSESGKVGPPAQGVLLAPRDLLDRRVTKVQQDHKVLMGRRVKKAPRGHKVQLVPKARKGHKDPRAQKATKVTLGLRVVPAVLLIMTCKISTIFCD